MHCRGGGKKAEGLRKGGKIERESSGKVPYLMGGEGSGRSNSIPSLKDKKKPQDLVEKANISLEGKKKKSKRRDVPGEGKPGFGEG